MATLVCRQRRLTDALLPLFIGPFDDEVALVDCAGRLLFVRRITCGINFRCIDLGEDLFKRLAVSTQLTSLDLRQCGSHRAHLTQRYAMSD
jgi:hypothetical protein